MSTNSPDVVRNFSTIPSGKLSYIRFGKGPPLVFLHSLALSADMWIPVMGEFATDFDVIAVDLRGHGHSKYDGKDFTVEDMANDLKFFLDDLNIQKTHLLGMSMGGCVAINFAATYPDYVDRLVLCDTTAWYGENAPTAWNERALTALRRPRVLQLPFQTERWFCEKFRRAHPDTVAYVSDLFLRTKPKVHAQASYALGKFDNRDKLANITAQALVLTGDEDGAAPPQMGEALSKGIPQSSFILFQGLRHFAVLESDLVRISALIFLVRGEIPKSPLADESPCCEAFGHSMHPINKENAS